MNLDANIRPGGGEPDSRADSITILLVDDDPSVTALVDATLASTGYRLLKAADSDQALRMSDAHDGPIHLLIADQVMPPFMSGNELATCLRMIRPEIKVLYISGYSANDGVADEVGDAEADFLPKPFTPSLLLHKVHRLIENEDGAEVADSDESDGMDASLEADRENTTL